MTPSKAADLFGSSKVDQPFLAVPEVSGLRSPSEVWGGPFPASDLEVHSRLLFMPMERRRTREACGSRRGAHTGAQ